MTKCRACNTRIVQFFSLGRMPLVNSFLKKEDIPKEKRFDLSVGFCSNCYLVQLMKTVNPKNLFTNYLYFSSVTQSIVDHSKKTSAYFIKRFKLTPENLIVEIGSNDGIHLQFYKDVGIQILGIDPAKNVAKIANERGIKTISEFFNVILAKKIVSQGIKADLIYGANVLAHVPSILDFVQGLKVVLKDKGTAIFEFPYVKGLIENKFDTIYHEHVFYFSLVSLKNLFKQVDLVIYDVEHIPMQGGSLRIFVSHTNTYKVSKHVKELIAGEIQEGFDKIATYRAISTRVNKLRKDLIKLLQTLKKDGKRIVGYGTPAKGNILLNYFGVSKYLDFIVDKSGAKQGLYTPGTHMFVYAPSKIFEERPHYLLVLCWNIADEVRKEFKRYKQDGGEFIIPIPKIKII